ncbi:MAG TPA: hypothetical protein VFU49_07725 [Ktedonobacteraceae bacterium]|nr:hypothetical protein [Ktedonobacteraceae bacterium]
MPSGLPPPGSYDAKADVINLVATKIQADAIASGCYAAPGPVKTLRTDPL